MRNERVLLGCCCLALLSSCGVYPLNSNSGGFPPGPPAQGTPSAPVSNGNSTPVTPVSPPPVTRPRYTLVGRFDTSDPNGPRYCFEGSKIGATFSGTSLSVDITDTGTDMFNVVIDGGNAIVLTVNANEALSHPVATALPPGTHTVWMSKRTEYLSGFVPLPGTVQFHDFALDANGIFMEGPAPKSRLIEAIGDSGFPGWGVETLVTDTLHDCNGNVAALENADESIPFYTAATCKAEVHNLSASGEAVVTSVVDSNPNHMLPVDWELLLPPALTPRYTFAQPADVVMLSAGGDDLFGAYGSGVIDNANTFVATYAAWLQTIRAQNPNAFIVVVLSQSAANQDKITLKTLYAQALQQAAPGGDPNMAYYDYWEGTPYTTYNDAAPATALGLYWGCGGHPSKAGAQYLGQRLGMFINAHMGWQ